MAIVLPFETGIFLKEFIEVRHELVNCFAHVHMPDLRPHSIRVRKRRCLVLVRARRRLELVP